MGSRNTWVAIFYISCIVTATVIFDKAFAMGMAMGNVANEKMLTDFFRMSTVLGLVLAIAIGGYCWVTPKIRNFANESIDELSKVAWPDWSETRSNTIVVIIFAFICSGILGVFDLVFSWGTNQITALF